MAGPRKALTGALLGYLGRLRFPALFAITTTLFLVDLVVPDAVPMVDELLLGLGAVMIGSWRKRREERQAEAAPGEEPRA